MFLTREQVEQLDLAECQRHLKLLAKTYNLDKPITEHWQQVWPNLDQIVDTLLYLEDQIHKLEISDTLSKANIARWANQKAEQ